MAEYSLTLSALKFANVTNFSRPFGTKKTALQNSGSLTTEEFNIANALPFDIQRPLVITETSTISNIQYDAKVVINAASTTLTLESTGVTEGIMVTLMAAYDATIVFNNTSSATTISDVLHAGEIAKLVFIGGRWEVVQDLGEVKANPSDKKPFGALIVDGSAYSKVKYPRLANFLGIRYNLSTDQSDVFFRLPNYRECVLVGAGQNTMSGIAEHDVYNIGEFKDDQMQTIPASDYSFDIAKYYDSRGGSLGSAVSAGKNVTEGNGSSLKGSDWSSSGPSSRVSWSDKGNTEQRNGSTTHGKQIGVNYIIKY